MLPLYTYTNIYSKSLCFEWTHTQIYLGKEMLLMDTYTKISSKRDASNVYMHKYNLEKRCFQWIRTQIYLGKEMLPTDTYTNKSWKRDASNGHMNKYILERDASNGNINKYIMEKRCFQLTHKQIYLGKYMLAMDTYGCIIKYIFEKESLPFDT